MTADPASSSASDAASRAAARPEAPSPAAAPVAGPVFLICSERSGSNLVSAMLGAHPAIHAHPPHHLGRDLLLNLAQTLPEGTASPAWDHLRRHACAAFARYAAPEDAAAFARDLDALSGPIDPVALARRVWTDLPAAARGRIPLVKENGVHHLIGFIVSAFPDARFIFQVRDPRDFLASAKARGGRILGNKFGSLRNALAVWREDQLGGLRALALLGPGRVRLHRYEDLVADPVGVLGGICGFLGLAFDPAMLSFNETDRARQLAVSGGPRENLARPLMTDNFGRYRATLSRRDIRTTEAFLGDLMTRFGYPLDYPYAPKPGAWASLRPQRLELWERLANGETRPFYKSGSPKLHLALAASARSLLPPLSYGADSRGAGGTPAAQETP